MKRAWGVVVVSPVVEASAVALLLGVYFALAARHWDCPGALAEGFFEQYFPLALLRGEWGGPVPLTYLDYNGALSGYLLLPFLWIFGPSWAFLRLWPIGLAIVTLGMIYLFARGFFGRGTGLLTLLLTVFQPSYLMGTKREFLGLPMHFITIGVCMGLHRFWERRDLRGAAAAMFLLGLGFWTHVFFAWFAVALAVVGMGFWKTVWARLSADGGAAALRRLGVGLLLALFGASPYVLGQATTDWRGFSFLVQCLKTPENPWRPTLYFSNAVYALGEFHKLLSGGAYYEMFFLETPETPFLMNPLYPVAFWTCAGVALGMFILAVRHGRRCFCLAVLVLVMLVLTPISPGVPAIAWLHFFIFYPWVTLLIASVAVNLWQVLPRRWLRVVVATALLALFAGDLRVLTAYERLLSRQGGTDRHTVALYDLADWLAVEGWNERPVYFHIARDMWQLNYLYPGGHRSWRNLVMGDTRLAECPPSGALVVANEYLPIAKQSPFPEWAAAMGGRLSPRRRFLDRAGMLAYTVYDLRPEAGRASPPSAPADAGTRARPRRS